MCNVQPIQMHQLKERSSMYKAKKNRELMETQETHENKVSQGGGTLEHQKWKSCLSERESMKKGDPREYRRLCFV